VREEDRTFGATRNSKGARARGEEGETSSMAAGRCFDAHHQPTTKPLRLKRVVAAREYKSASATAAVVSSHRHTAAGRPRDDVAPTFREHRSRNSSDYSPRSPAKSMFWTWR
jgi:hypothetical protein